MKKFLFATDFSEASENAFLYTKELIKGKDVRLDIINVFDMPLSYSTQTPSKAVQGYLQELKAASLRRMTELLDRLPTENRGELHPIYGMYASTEIDEIGQASDIDMIIMSLRKDYGILKRMMGNTTSRTIEKTPIPVLAIPAKAAASEINNILFPTAISSSQKLPVEDTDAILWLSVFSGFLDTPDIELVHILDDADMSAVDVTIDRKNFEKLKFTSSHAMTVEEGIYKYMNKKKPDLLAFYKKHRTFWERLYRPSKTRHLLYDSSIPILVFG